ncbi:PKD domain-containing protein [Pedobacter nutrimenti]|uniref:Putative secreted protein (Por secretion system target) n=1 Tax=Pedobacter nutrimenti TaxID=1241337 RepID=A0A318U7C6_9SPHI|nr:T9SS type A sorting domain-containing protein [Pedobacter nutrimenti]PYF68432.1 putative secreted protein (Por secretion system target) [Pedobacter nutrimenti]
MKFKISYVLFLLLYITGARTSQAQTTSSKIICAGSSTVLLGPTSPGVKWFKDGKLIATTRDITVNTAGEYVVVAISQHGCESDASDPVNVIISNPPEAPKVILVQPNCVLSTGTITIENALDNNTYSINGGSYDKKSVFSDLPAGTYTLIAKNENGCTSTSTIVNLIRDQPSGDFTYSSNQVSFGGAITFTSGVPGAISYEWNFGDGGISYEANPKHYFYKEGTFTITLKVQTSGGCNFTVTKNNLIKVGQDTSTPNIPVIIPPSGIDNSPLRFFAYPNPFKDKFYVSVSSEINQNIRIELIDMRGNRVYSKDYLVNPGNNTVAIEKLPAMAQGVYTLRVSGQGIKNSINLLKI